MISVFVESCRVGVHREGFCCILWSGERGRSSEGLNYGWVQGAESWPGSKASRMVEWYSTNTLGKRVGWGG